MKIIGLILAGFLVVSGVYLWLSTHIGPLPSTTQAAAVIEATEKPFLAEGVLLAYTASDSPTYYLLYETQSHDFARKELRFVSKRGCTPSAGDMPCVLTEDENAPPVPLGSIVRVSGTRVAQRVQVESLRYATGITNKFSTVWVDSGSSVTSKGISVAVSSTRYSEGCEVFVGCFKETIPKAVLSLDAGSQHREVTLVPGMLTDVPNGAVALIWASPEEDSAYIVIAHE